MANSPRLVKQMIEHGQPVVLIAVTCWPGCPPRTNATLGPTSATCLLVTAAGGRFFAVFRLYRSGSSRPQQNVAVFQYGMQRATVVSVVPTLADDLRVQSVRRRRAFSSLRRNSLPWSTSTPSPPGLGQDAPDQLQLSAQRQVTPEQYQVRRLRDCRGADELAGD